eukprot:TRINITY_DN9994_c0_g1_i1.p1 TRINITY_DN9994_c0_g1~~TRINITY_DN9994_c0_g1_i1.p1  ORF type:complete len:282 (+),score=56.38 TRINITY_DN9994_c0_g1_i1:43-846(+)
MTDGVSRERYNALKRKYVHLEDENAELAKSLDASKFLIRSLTLEKTYLLDRLLKWESLSSDSDTSTASDSSSSTESESDVIPERKFKKPRLSNNSTDPNNSGSSTADKSGQALCVAVVKNRPCKSKALQNSLYCWHHAPLDPASTTIWCQYKDPTKRNKKCSIPVPKTKAYPFCQYHEKKGKEQLLKSTKDDSTTTSTNPTTTTTKSSPGAKQEGAKSKKKKSPAKKQTKATQVVPMSTTLAQGSVAQSFLKEGAMKPQSITPDKKD